MRLLLPSPDTIGPCGQPRRANRFQALLTFLAVVTSAPGPWCFAIRNRRETTCQTISTSGLRRAPLSATAPPWPNKMRSQTKSCAGHRSPRSVAPCPPCLRPLGYSTNANILLFSVDDPDAAEPPCAGQHQDQKWVGEPQSGCH
jgi:hypothetical protein